MESHYNMFHSNTCDLHIYNCMYIHPKLVHSHNLVDVHMQIHSILMGIYIHNFLFVH